MTHSHDVYGTGQGMRGSDEAPAGCTAQGFKGQEKASSLDCAQASANRKRIATLKARAALVGLALQELHDGACVLVGEAGKPAPMPSLQAAESLVYGCELVRAELAAMAGRLVPRRGGQA